MFICCCFFKRLAAHITDKSSCLIFQPLQKSPIRMHKELRLLRYRTFHIVFCDVFRKVLAHRVKIQISIVIFFLLYCPISSVRMQNTNTHFVVLYNFVTSFSIHAPCINCLFSPKVRYHLQTAFKSYFILSTLV